MSGAAAPSTHSLRNVMFRSSVRNAVGAFALTFTMIDMENVFKSMVRKRRGRGAYI
jgi:hypothetical protein